MIKITSLAVLELRVIIFKLGWKHHKLTAEVCYILHSFNRCRNWNNYILFNVLDRIGDDFLCWFRKMKDLYSFICVRSTKFDGRLEYITSISLDIIYPFIISIKGLGRKSIRVRQFFELVFVGVYLWCSYRIFRMNRRHP